MADNTIDAFEDAKAGAKEALVELEKKKAVNAPPSTNNGGVKDDNPRPPKKDAEPQHQWLERTKGNILKQDVPRIRSKNPGRAGDVEKLLKWTAEQDSTPEELKSYRGKLFSAQDLAELDDEKEEPPPAPAIDVSTQAIKAKARELQPRVKPTDKASLDRIAYIFKMGDMALSTNVEEATDALIAMEQGLLRDELNEIKDEEPELAEVINNLLNWQHLTRESSAYEVARAQAALEAASMLLEFEEELDQANAEYNKLLERSTPVTS